MGFKDAVKKRDIGSSIKNVGKLFKRREAQPEINAPEQANERTEEEPQDMEVNLEAVEPESGASAVEPELEPVSEAEEPAPIDHASTSNPAVPVKEVKIPAKTATASPIKSQETPGAAKNQVTTASTVKTSVATSLPDQVKSSSTPATLDIATSTKSPPFSSTWKSEEKPARKAENENGVQDAAKSRSKKGDASARDSTRVKGKSEKKDREEKMPEPKLNRFEEKIPPVYSKLGIDYKRLAEIKEKMRTILAVSTRIRIDMLREYIGVENGQFVPLLVNFAKEFSYKIDGDFIVPETVLVNKYTVK